MSGKGSPRPPSRAVLRRPQNADNQTESYVNKKTGHEGVKKSKMPSRPQRAVTGEHETKLLASGVGSRHPHIPDNSRNVKKHDCLDEVQKTTAVKDSPFRPITRRHPLDMPNPKETAMRSRSVGPGPSDKDHKRSARHGKKGAKKNEEAKSRKRRAQSNEGKMRSSSSPGKRTTAKGDAEVVGKTGDGESPTLIIIDKEMLNDYAELTNTDQDEGFEELNQAFVSSKGEVKGQDSIVEDYEYLQFLLRITEDIIRNDLYTNKDMKRVCLSHFEANRERLDLDRMQKQIELLSQELGISLDESENNLQASREEIRRKRQGIKSTLMCSCGEIFRPDDGFDYEDCLCNSLQCLPFQCVRREPGSEDSKSNSKFPHKEGCPCQQADESGGNVELDAQDMSVMKCRCLENLSEHTEPTDEEDNAAEDTLKGGITTPPNSVDVGDAGALFGSSDSQEEECPFAEQCKVIPDFCSSTPAVPQQRECSFAAQCEATPNFCFSVPPLPKKNPSPPKLLDSCTIAPDFCSSIPAEEATKLFDSCNIMPDFCAPMDTKPDTAITSLTATPPTSTIQKPISVRSANVSISSNTRKEPSVRSVTVSVQKEPIIKEDEVTRLMSFDYDLTPEKDDTNLSFDFTTFNIIPEEIAKLSDLKLKDLLLDDAYEMPEKPTRAKYPAWYLKSVETQTTDSAHKMMVTTVDSSSQSDSSGVLVLTDYQQISSEKNALSSSKSSSQTSSDAVNISSGSKTLSTIEETESEDKVEEKVDSESCSEDSKSDEGPKSNDSDEKSDESSENHHIAVFNVINDDDSEEEADEEPQKQPLQDEDDSDDDDYTYGGMQYSEPESRGGGDLKLSDDSTDEEVEEYVAELNKKPVLSVTRSIEDRIASVTERLEKFRQVNEVRNVSATNALEENIKKNLSHTENAPQIEERSSHIFEFIPPTLNPSDTDISCCPPLRRKKKVKEVKELEAEDMVDKPYQRTHVVIADEMGNDPDAKRSIRFSQIVIKQHQEAQKGIAAKRRDERKGFAGDVSGVVNNAGEIRS